METSREHLDASALQGSDDETEPGERALNYARRALRRLHERASGRTIRSVGRERVDGSHN